MVIADDDTSQPGAEALTEPASRVSHRPFNVTLLILLGLSIVGFGLVRLVQTLVHWPYLASLRSFLPAYLLLTAILLSGAGLVVVWGLWWGRHWAPNMVRLVCLVLFIYYWLDMLLVTEQASRNTNPVFILSLQIIVLALVFGMLASPSTKQYFRRSS